jgi:hypothetical protein
MAHCADEAPTPSAWPCTELPAIVSLTGLRSMPSKLGRNLLPPPDAVSFVEAMGTPHCRSSLLSTGKVTDRATNCRYCNDSYLFSAI